MDFEVDRDPGPQGDPSLADMTRSALSILSKNPKGFLLVVEGKCYSACECGGYCVWKCS